MWVLAALECTEVMVEVTSEVVMREPGKWAVVILLQCVKAMLRGILVFYMRSGLLTSPPVPSPDRKQAKVTVVSYTVCRYIQYIQVHVFVVCTIQHTTKVNIFSIQYNLRNTST